MSHFESLNFGIFQQFLSYTILVTLFGPKLQVFKKVAKTRTMLGIFI